MRELMTFADGQGSEAYDINIEISQATIEQPMAFGRFEVFPEARSVLLDGEDLALGGRAFDLLVVLLRSRGRVVSKQEIVRAVWPTTYVDESNLRFQMGMLRKALGRDRDRIKTVAGRGYLFVGDAPMRDGRANEDVPLVTSAPPITSSDEHVILIVDPDPEERDAITALLRTFGREVRGFASAAEIGLAVNMPVLQ